jgi:hypothetical protein
VGDYFRHVRRVERIVAACTPPVVERDRHRRTVGVRF